MLERLGSERIFHKSKIPVTFSLIYQKILQILEQRQYKNDSTESRCMFILKLPHFSTRLTEHNGPDGVKIVQKLFLPQN